MTPDQVNRFFSFLYDGGLGDAVFWLRFVAGMLTAAMAAAIAIIAIKFRQLLTAAPKPAPSSAEAAARADAIARKPWQEVTARLDSPNPADWNLAVIQADAILDGVLKDMGLPGETMGDRLKGLDRAKLQTLNGAWEAHKLRNRVVHETDRVLAHEEARRAVTLYCESLSEFGYL